MSTECSPPYTANELRLKAQFVLNGELPSDLVDVDANRLIATAEVLELQAELITLMEENEASYEKRTDERIAQLEAKLERHTPMSEAKVHGWAIELFERYKNPGDMITQEHVNWCKAILRDLNLIKEEQGRRKQ